jgi:hypothetical protein
MSKPKQRYWKVTYTMHPPFGEGSCKVWADNAEKAIALAKSHQNIREITGVTIVGME